MARALAQLLPATLVVLAACGGGDDEEQAAAPTPTPTATAAAADETVSFRLAEEHGSGRSGTARLEGGADGFTVTLRVKPQGDAAPAHIHDVTCEEYRATEGFDAQLATVDTALTDLRRGRSKTSVASPLTEYRAGGYAINVHSTKGGFPVVACGDIPAG